MNLVNERGSNMEAKEEEDLLTLYGRWMYMKLNIDT